MSRLFLSPAKQRALAQRRRSQAQLGTHLLRQWRQLGPALGHVDPVLVAEGAELAAAEIQHFDGLKEPGVAKYVAKQAARGLLLGVADVDLLERAEVHAGVYGEHVRLRRSQEDVSRARQTKGDALPEA